LKHIPPNSYNCLLVWRRTSYVSGNIVRKNRNPNPRLCNILLFLSPKVLNFWWCTFQRRITISGNGKHFERGGNYFLIQIKMNIKIVYTDVCSPFFFCLLQALLVAIWVFIFKSYDEAKQNVHNLVRTQYFMNWFIYFELLYFCRISHRGRLFST